MNQLYNNVLIKNYGDAAKLFATARNKEKGKPVMFMSWARLYKDGNDYTVCYLSRVLFRITPDSMLVWECTPDELRRCAATVVSALYRVVPFDIIRVGMGRYRIGHFMHIIPVAGTRRDWIDRDLLKQQPELFSGLSFSMLTGECNNRQPDLMTTVNPAARKQWLSTLRQYKRGLKVRQKIGALDAFAAAATAQKQQRKYAKPDWSQDSWKDRLFECIRDQKYPEDLLTGVAQSVRVYYYQNTVNPQDILTQFDTLCNQYSIDLRRRFGVFTGQGE